MNLFEQEYSPKKLIKQFVDEVYNDMKNDKELANLLILMTQSFISGGSNLRQNEIIELNTKMFHVTANLVKRGQKLGEFRSGNPYELAEFFYSVVQGLAMMSIIRKGSFTMPSPTVITAFLFKEGE